LLEKIGFTKPSRITRIGRFDQNAENLTASLTAELIGFASEGRFKPSGAQGKAA
jgi:hypothetical protein